MAVHLLLRAGGRGTRFWPLSRHRRPKQLLPLASSQSLRISSGVAAGFRRVWSMYWAISAGRSWPLGV